MLNIVAAISRLEFQLLT